MEGAFSLVKAHDRIVISQIQRLCYNAFDRNDLTEEIMAEDIEKNLETVPEQTDVKAEEISEKKPEKKAGKRVARVALVLALLFLSGVVLYLADLLLRPKYMGDVTEGALTAEYYEAYGDHDVLFVGDCEVYENFSTVQLWKEFGINSFIRGGAQQLVWQSYYLLEDALRYETPDVVVFNVLSLMYNEPQNEAYNRMALDGMRWSKTKWDAINASMCEGENMIEYIFPILRYHSRWNELTSDDFKYWFKKDLVSFNGYYLRNEIMPAGDMPPVRPLGDYSFGDKAMKYLDKMTELCKEKGIKLVLIKSPSLYPHWYDEWDENMKQYAEENDLLYINMLEIAESEIGIDYSLDTYDAGLHMNVTGAEKCSSYLGKVLVEKYGLTDHRDDPDMAEYWDEVTKRYEAAKNA